MENSLENNVVTVIGSVSAEPVYSHEVYGEGFYSFVVNLPRLSDKFDQIPILVSERLVPIESLKIGKFLEIQGQFRSYNAMEKNTNKLLLTVFAREVLLIDEAEEIKNPNQIFLNGFVCKKPIYRMTPFGREICDILVAVNRAYNKSDYLPCICWGRNARYCENLKLGDNIKLWGRIQSREYVKKLGDDTSITNIAYEISVSKLEIVRKETTEFHEQESIGQKKDSKEPLKRVEGEGSLEPLRRAEGEGSLEPLKRAEGEGSFEPSTSSEEHIENLGKCSLQSC